MACEAIIDYLVRESGRFMETSIRELTFAQSPWMALTPRGQHPTGMGEIINILTRERSAPLSDLTWNPMLVESGAEGGICLPDRTTVRTGSTTRWFQLYGILLEGPEFCAEETRSPFQNAQQINSITHQLSEYVRLAWEQHDRNEYFRITKNKSIVNGTCPSPTDRDGLETWDAVATALGVTCPTSQLTQGVLDRERMYLVRNGATPIARLSTGKPILALVSDAETLDGLIRNNDDIRTDIRYATMGEMNMASLLQPMGIEREYRGFLHIEDMYPNRYECSGGTYTKVPTWVEEAATKGVKAELNTAWLTATYTESNIHSSSVLKQLIPAPIGAIAGLPINPVNYVGSIKWMNYPDKQCNPLGQIVTPLMRLVSSTMPDRPDTGTSFVHLRCDPPCSLITSCTT